MTDDALRLEVAIVLLPLLGRVEEVSAGRFVAMRANRLTDHETRRLVIDDVAAKWGRLTHAERHEYGTDPKAALVWYVAEYVERVEAAGADADELFALGNESAMEMLWHLHADGLRAAG